MKFKKIMFVGILLLAIFAIGAVSASDVNDTAIANEDTSQIELSDSDKVIKDNLQTSEENDELTLTDNDVLGVDSATYSDLASEIGQSGNVKLTHKNYTYNTGATAITITEANKVIDGDGAVIDMAGSTIRAFTISTSGVTIKNLTIKNANYNDDGGAIYFSSSGTVTNCNFVNNTARYGGAVYFLNTGTVSNCNFADNHVTGYEALGGAVYMQLGSVENCNFNNNTATGKYSKGGAVCFYGEGTVSNCNFADNTATYYGGAVYFLNQGTVSNCNFIDNKATGDYSYGGGAVFFLDQGTVTNCNFVNNTAWYGGAIRFSGEGTVSNCNFINNKAEDYGGAIRMNSGTVSNCNFTDNTASSNGGAIRMNDGTVSNCNFADNTAYRGAVYFYYDGSVSNCNFTNNTATYDGGAVYFSSNGEVTNCNFADNTATYDGGAVYFWKTGIVSNCNFINNSARYGGAVEFDGTGTVSNCNFVENTAKMGNAIYINNKCTISDCDFTKNFLTKGAIHSVTGDITLSNNALNVDDAVKGKNFTEIQKLIDAANEGDEITIDGLYAGFGIPITITKSLTLIGQNNAILDAKKLSKILFTANNVIIKNIQFTNGYAANGGAVFFFDQGTVTNCNFINNTASEDGGGGAVWMSSGTVSNCNFVNNTAWYGGAIRFSGEGTVTNCNFINNSARYGGAVEFDGTGTVSNCNFINNTATYYGGAVYFLNQGTVSNCNFINNTASEDGGAVYFYQDTGSVTNCNFINNSARSGGAIYIYNSCKINSSIFLLNKNTFNRAPVFDNCFFWFGNNVSNYETKQYNYIDSWLFLDATSSPVTGVEGKSAIVFNLKSYNSTSKSITIPDITNLPDMIFDLSATNGYLSKYSTRLGESVIFTSTIYKDGTVKASYYGATYSVIISNLNLEAPDVNKYYNGSERFIVTLSDSSHKPVSNKNVSITIDGKTTTGVTDNAGHFSIPLDLDPGNYIVTSSYNGVIVKSNVNIYSTIEFGNVNGVYKDVTFNATILDSSGKPVKGKDVEIKMGNLDFTAVSDSNGVVRVSPDLDAGSYVMTVTNPVTGEVKSSDVVISKASSTVSISSETFAHGVTLSATILPGNISGEVVFTINGNQDYSEDVVNSKSSITLRNMDSGKYTAVVTFKGNANYNASTSSQITFDVDEYDYVISAPDVTKDYGGPEKFNITLTKNNVPIANANVKITLKDVDYTKTTDKNGKISMDISNLDAGVYGVVVKYNSITANSVIIVNQLPTSIDLSFVKHSSDNVTLTAKITPSAVGEIVFTVNGKDYKVNITAGKAILDLPGLDDGNYSAKAVYKGATNYKSSTSNTVSFIVDKGSIFIYAPDVTKEYGGLEKFNITLTRYNIPVAGANVKITINGVEYNETTDSEGKISIDISDLNVGVYDAVVKYDSVSVKSVITVNLISTKITWSASKITTVYNGNKYLVATLIDSNKKPMVGVKVTIKLSNGKTLTPTTNAKGQVTISTNGLAPVKTYTATITFAGNGNYAKSTKSVKVTIKKANPKLIASAKAYKVRAVKKYAVALKTNRNVVMKNTLVTIKVGKITLNARTNIKGIATFNLAKLAKKGNYKAVITYKGNNYYNKATRTVYIRVV